MNDTTKKITEMIVVAAEDKKATDVLTFDVEGVSGITDAFVICSAKSTIQVQAIADHIEEELKKQGVEMLHQEGHRAGRWILLDFGDCIVHVFEEEERQFYNLERLLDKTQPRGVEPEVEVE